MTAHDRIAVTRLAHVRGSGATWHRVRCSCGWTRKYVSRYRCEVQHRRHQAAEGARVTA